MSEPLSYTYKTAADATGLSKQTIERAVKSRALPAKRSSTASDGEPTGVVVILHDDLTAWLKGLVDA
jgi:hypothetical protein